MSACLLCGCTRSAALFHASDRLFGTTTEEFAVVRCGKCGLLRLDPPPAPEKLSQYYPADYWFSPDQTTAGRLEEAYRRLVLRDHVRFVHRALRSTRAAGPLLDVGCGGGLFLGLMRGRGFRVVGLDFSAQAAALAWRQQGVPAVCALLEHAPFRPASLARPSPCSTCWSTSTIPRAYLLAARAVAGTGRPPGRAGAQRRLLAVPLPRATRWNGIDVPRHLFDFRDRGPGAPARHACGFEVVRRKLFLAARQSRRPGQQPGARVSTRWRGASQARGERRHAARQGPGATSRWSRRRCRSPRLEAACRRRQHRHDRGAPPVSIPTWPTACRARCGGTSCTSKWKSKMPWPLLPQACPSGARVLDAGAGEGQYAHLFRASAIAAWTWRWATPPGTTAAWTPWPTSPRCPSARGQFDGRHSTSSPWSIWPNRRARWPEIARTLAPGGLLLVAAPHEWEVHQAPHDYFRYTRYGLRYLLEKAGFEVVRDASGGRLSSGCSRGACSTVYNSSQGAFAGWALFRPRFSWSHRR